MHAKKWKLYGQYINRLKFLDSNLFLDEKMTVEFGLESSLISTLVER